MTPDEKRELLALFDSKERWCQGCEARDEQGEPVSYGDEAAVAWDVVGGLCHLFGWRRACQLFEQVHRHVVGPSTVRYRENADMLAMGALFDYNDAFDTTHETLLSALKEMPVWRGHHTVAEEDATCES